MKEILVKEIASEPITVEGLECLEKVYKIDDKEVSSIVATRALNPLRLLEHALIKKGMEIKKMLKSDNPCDFDKITIKYNEYEDIEKILKEIMEYRCCPDYKEMYNYQIDMLPFEVCMKTSDAIMNFGKDKEDIEKDNELSKRRWNRIRRQVDQIYGEYSVKALEVAKRDESNNPSILTISKDNPEKRKHLIYQYKRGGYTIKTQNYLDRSLDHYSYFDTRMWD